MAAALAAWQYAQESDLRRLDALRRTSAEVLGEDYHRRGPDSLEVRFAGPGGVPVETEIPWSGSADPGDTVDVAYVGDDPGRVRTVEAWSPAYETFLTYAALLGLLALGFGAFGLVSLLRDGEYEKDAPVADGPDDPGLGRRVVRSGMALQVGLVALGVAGAAPLFYTGLVQPDDREIILGGLVVVALLVGAAGGFHWWAGRDGVWVTATHLVARRRGRLTRWPWEQVRELGLVVEKRSVTVPAARVDDGSQDGIGVDGWVTLAVPWWGHSELIAARYACAGWRRSRACR